ncbi:DUF4440 domain-containing protein [Aeromonas allosaccharophila]|uniref:nuclear transport factor 2 family protein n=1 Tax=Aeromonas allosaccharophila TaxID=656 RepID=UPI003987D4CF
MLLETLKDLELALHDPDVRASVKQLQVLLHPSFREFGRSGAVYLREDILAHMSTGGAETIIWAQDFELEVLSPELALLTYRSANLGDDQRLQSHTNRSSLWQFADGCWQMRFHQGTATQPFDPNRD